MDPRIEEIISNKALRAKLRKKWGLDENSIDDVIQETCVIVYQNLYQLCDQKKFWPWVYAIAMREGLRLTIAQKNPASVQQQNGTNDTDQANALILEETVERLLQASEELDTKEAVVARLLIMEAIKFAIGHERAQNLIKIVRERLGIPYHTARRLLISVREKLWAALNQDSWSQSIEKERKR